MKTRSNLLIIGAYPRRKIFGGFVTDCHLLRESSIYHHFNVIEFDSTQISNPPPKFWLRFIFSFIKFSRFFRILLLYKFEAIVIFLPNGSGALEKLFWAWIFSLFNCRAHIFLLPRAGAWFDELLNYPQWFKNKIFSTDVTWLVQGKKGLKFIHSINNEARVKMIYPFVKSESGITISVPNSLFRFIFVGWLEPSKGVIELLEALRLVSADFEFVFVGDGSLSSILELRAREDSRIKNLGWLQAPEVLREISNAHCLLLPSFHEGLPNVIAEAMSLGRAVIANDVGEISSVLPCDQLIASNNPHAIAVAMLELLESKDLVFDKMCRNYQLSSSHFGIQAFDATFFEFFYDDIS